VEQKTLSISQITYLKIQPYTITSKYFNNYFQTILHFWRQIFALENVFSCGTLA